MKIQIHETVDQCFTVEVPDTEDGVEHPEFSDALAHAVDSYKGPKNIHAIEWDWGIKCSSTEES